MIAKNCASARHLEARIAQSEVFAVAAPVTLNIVCFHLKQRASAEVDDAKIADIVAQLQWDGIAAPSTTRIGDRLCIRVAILNHRTENGDLDLLLQAATAAAQGIPA
jgi:glutamate/tyrosine decarboxylase-like PLP-dependent enzyme